MAATGSSSHGRHPGALQVRDDGGVGQAQVGAACSGGTSGWHLV
jgi:hypothetical protein